MGGLDLNPLDWPGDLIKFAESSPPVEDLVNFALKRLLGFDPPWSLVRLALMLEGDIWSAAQQAVNLWWRMENAGLNPWNLLGQVLDGIASVGPGGFIRDQIREFWRPIWTAMQTLEAPTKGVEAFAYAAQDALNTEMKRMIEGQQARATDQVSIDNGKMQAALKELASRWTQNRQANETLHDALYTYIPDAAGIAVNGVDLVEVIFFIAAVIDSGGIAIIAAPELLDVLFDEDYDIFAVAILAGYEATAVWLAAQNLDLNALPKQIAQVAANPPAVWISPALVQDEKTLEDHGCSLAAIRSFMSNPQINQGYIHEIVQYHPDQACVILTSIDTIIRSGNQVNLGGLVATEDDLRQNGITFTGALFHIQWMAHHPQIIAAIEQPVSVGDRPDVLTGTGTVVDCKSVVQIGDYADQISGYAQQYRGQPIEYVFNGDKLLDPRYANANLARIEAMASGQLTSNQGQPVPAVSVDVVLSDAMANSPAGQAFIAQLQALKAKGLPVTFEIWPSLTSV